MVATQDWSDDELRAAVVAYLNMLKDELAGRVVNKTACRDQLLSGVLSRRTGSSIEYRLQNISYVLETMGLKRIVGYAPAANVGSGVQSRIKRIITEHNNATSNLLLRDIVPNVDLIMGVKAVFRPLSSHVLCFGGRGDVNNRKQYYSVPAGIASRAVERPFTITIGGGKNVRPGYEGRVLNLTRVSKVYGLTALLVTDPEELKLLAQWPVSIALNDVWKFVGDPHLVQDLGMPDRTILSGAQDGIIRPLDKLQRLWAAIEKWPVEPVVLPNPANFYEGGAPRLVISDLPAIPADLRAEEGKRVWTLQIQIERDAKLSREAKRLNNAKYGKFTCEACGFQHDDAAMFDAHHPTPLAVGLRTTYSKHLDILCPTCHRRAHRSGDKLQPFTIDELRRWVAEGRF